MMTVRQSIRLGRPGRLGRLLPTSRSGALAWLAASAGVLAALTFAPVASAGTPAQTPDPANPSDPASGTPAADGTPATTTGSTKPAPPTTAGSKEAADDDVTEKPGQRYIYIGLRYRGDVIPQFLVNAFVTGGRTFYSNIFGVEADIRKDNFSIIPALTYESYGSGGPIIFLQKGAAASTIGNWSEVESSMKAIFATVDFMWSAKIHKNIDFEYGTGVGVGVVFGGLLDNWVYSNPAGNLKAPAGFGYTAFSACNKGDTEPGCNGGDHTSATPVKTGGYMEKSWFNGGVKPSFLPWIALPELGLRFKPVKQVEGRIQLGLSLTGLWFGISANYGLPESKDGPKK